jgi:hypothetical protein
MYFNPQKIFCSMVLIIAFISSCKELFANELPAKDMRVDLVIFSYDRPLQLYALLESVQEYFQGINETHVIFRTSNQNFDDGYQIVKKKFPWVVFNKQSSNPHEDFKPLVLKAVYTKTSMSRYIMFAVDDIIVKDYANLEKCTKAIEKWGAWGFFLALGKNINYTYTIDMQSLAPATGKNIGKKLFLWKFSDGKGHWCYPNSVDMTIYSKEEIRNFLETETYIHPNSLESQWAARWADLEKRGICFSFSKTVNLPLNMVASFQNRCAHSYSTNDLLLKLHQGFKINIADFFKMSNPSAHIEHDLSFIPME